MGKSRLVLSAIAAFSLTAPPANGEITLTNSTSVAAPRTANGADTTDTVSNWGLNGGNTVAVYFTAENASAFTATFGGQSMTVVETFDGDRFVAGIAYLINPTVSVGDVVINGTNTASRLSHAYSVVSLSGVGSVAATDSRTSNGSLSYTTTLDGGYVLGAAMNNAYQGPAPTVTGNPDLTLFSQPVDGNASMLHAHGEVTTAGTYSDTYNGGIEAAAAVAFEPGGSPPPADTFPLTITPATLPDTGYDLAWESQSGKLYNLHTSPDLTGVIPTWTLVEGDIEATPPTNTYNVTSADPRRFYAVEEFDAPPPPPLFATDFEADNGGFTVSTTAGSAWQWGVPDSNNGQSPPTHLLLTAGNSGTSAWGTNLGTTEDAGFYANATTFLRSPVIDLSAATAAGLSFAEAVDFSATDSATVYIISDSDDTEIAGPIHTSSTGAIRTAGWASANGGDPIALPAAALGRAVRLEWRFTGETAGFLGWYIDDVAVTAE